MRVVLRALLEGALERGLVARYVLHQGVQVFEALGRRMDEGPGSKVELFLDVGRA